MLPSKRLLLFDIDGTLIASGGAEGALRDAMKDRFGVGEDLQGITLAGATDSAISRVMLEKNGIEATPENIAALLDAYLAALKERLPRHAGRLLPGIVKLLDGLRGRDDCILALLTGNVARGAEVKLTHYGVWDYFEFGAFADDHHDRNELGKFARARAYETRRRVSIRTNLRHRRHAEGHRVRPRHRRLDRRHRHGKLHPAPSLKSTSPTFFSTTCPRRML